MGILDYIKKIYKTNDIQKNYLCISDFLADIINFFIDVVDNKLDINDEYITNFRFYLQRYDNDINDNILPLLNILLNKTKSNKNNKYSFVIEVLNKHSYKENDISKDIDKLFFDENSYACFDLVCRYKKICRYVYPDGYSLIDKVFMHFKYAIENQNESKDYYRRLIFTMLSSNFYKNSKKIDVILEKLKEFKNVNNNYEVGMLINSISCLKEGLNQKNVKYLLNSYKIGTSFSSKIERVNQIQPHYDEIEDMRNRLIITIDSGHNVVKDDAISIHMDGENYILTIYIADAASFVSFDSLLYIHALQKGSSLYCNYPKCSYLSMFPNETCDFLSLNKGVDKYVVAHEFVFSKNFDFIRCDVKHALINVNKNYFYKDFLLINNNDSNYDMIYLLDKLADILIKNFNINVGSVIGKKIVSASNIFLNSWVSDYFKRFNYPFVFLNSEKFDSVSIGDCQLWEGFVSSYSYESFGNIINGGNPYGYVSKPIRNFSSFLNQYFERFYLLEWHNLDQRREFASLWAEQLPKLILDLNNRILLNNEFTDIVAKTYKK